MTNEELHEILEAHKKWLATDEDEGERADLSYSNLRGANLSYADLSYSNLRGANLSYANLWNANLTGVDIDYSTWPLWCGSRGVKVDLRIVYQLLAHVACLDCDEPEFAEIREKILPYARKSHRAEDLELVE